MRWLVLQAALAAGCTHSPEPLDHGQMFLGDWDCSSGTREIDCGEGVVVADLALGPGTPIQFGSGTVADLVLRIRSRGLVTDVGGPICELEFDANRDNAVLHAESSCLDEQLQSIVVPQGSAEIGWYPDRLQLTTVSTNSRSCRIETQAVCSAR